MKNPYRVAVIGPGGLGQPSIREVLRLPEMELAGVLAFSDAKRGVDAGTLVGMGPCGVNITTDFNEFCQLETDTVIYTGRDFGDWRADDHILALLEAGHNVVTPLPYHYLKVRGEDVEARFEAAAKKGRATLLGSGITPGFFNERLAMLLTGLSNDVKHIKFQEFFNVGPMEGAADLLTLFGFGANVEEAQKSDSAAMLAENYLREPIMFAADRLGITLDSIERTSQVKTTDVAISAPSMSIEPDTVGLVSYAWTGYSQGEPFYTTEVFYFLGDGMRPDECSGDDFWTVEIEGRPSIRAAVSAQASFAENIIIRPDEPSPPGYTITVIACIQAIPALVKAEPGLMQPDMPQFHWKPDQRN